MLHFFSSVPLQFNIWWFLFFLPLYFDMSRIFWFYACRLDMCHLFCGLAIHFYLFHLFHVLPLNLTCDTSSNVCFSTSKSASFYTYCLYFLICANFSSAYLSLNHYYERTLTTTGDRYIYRVVNHNLICYCFSLGFLFSTNNSPQDYRSPPSCVL